MKKLIYSLTLILLAFQIALGQSLDDQLLDAVKANNRSSVIQLLKEGADPDVRDENGATAVMWAVYKADIALLKILIKNGANPSLKGVIYLDSTKQSYYGNITGIAAGEGNLEKLKFLLEDLKIPVSDRELNPQTGKEDGWTAADWAWENCLKCHDYLDSLGFDVLKSKKEITPSKRRLEDACQEFFNIGIEATDLRRFELAEGGLKEFLACVDTVQYSRDRLFAKFVLGTVFFEQDKKLPAIRLLDEVELSLAQLLSVKSQAYDIEVHMRVLKMLSYLHGSIGMLSEADRLYEKAVSFASILWKNEPLKRFWLIRNWRIIKSQMGDREQVKVLMDSMVSISKFNLPKSYELYLNNALAEYHYSVLRNDQALALLEKSEKLCLGADCCIDVCIDASINSGIVLSRQGDYELARSKFLDVYTELMKREVKTEFMKQDSEEGYQKRIITVLLNLGALESTLSNFSDAINHYCMADSLVQSTGHFHARNIPLRKLSVLHAANGNCDISMTTFDAYQDMFDKAIAETFTKLSFSDKRNFIDAFQSDLVHMRCAAINCSHLDQASESFFEIELKSKEILLQSERLFRSTNTHGINEGEDYQTWLNLNRDLVRVKSTLNIARQRYVGLGVSVAMKGDTMIFTRVFDNTPADLSGLKDGDALIILNGERVAGVSLTQDMILKLLKGQEGDVHELSVYRENEHQVTKYRVSLGWVNRGNPNISEIETRIKRLERKILSSVKDGVKQLISSNQTWKDIQSELGERDVAIEFSSFPYYRPDGTWSDSTVYVALVLRKDYEHPVMVKLCEEKQLDSLFQGEVDRELIADLYRGAVPVGESGPSYGKRLYELLWEPLDTLLNEGDHIHFAPSGLLHKIALSAIPYAHSDQLLSDRYYLNRLSTTAKLVTDKDKEEKRPEEIVLFGGIDYDLLPSKNDKEQETYVSRALPVDLDRGNTSWSYLPGTLKETESIATMASSKKVKVTTYTGTEATEEQIKSLGGKNSPTVLHIASHGFFFPDPEKDYEKDRMMQMMGDREQVYRYSDDPLNRAGLLFSGANHTWQNKEVPDGQEDGILTANEATYIPLTNTELVVLSACETGLGEIKGSEGVFGLQRAFKAAGAEYVMMSLWKVPDQETSEFMESFYGHYLSDHTIPDSYHHAQRVMREKYPNDPYKWAGFVLMR